MFESWEQRVGNQHSRKSIQIDKHSSEQWNKDIEICTNYVNEKNHNTIQYEPII